MEPRRVYPFGVQASFTVARDGDGQLAGFIAHGQAREHLFGCDCWQCVRERVCGACDGVGGGSCKSCEDWAQAPVRGVVQGLSRASAQAMRKAAVKNIGLFCVSVLPEFGSCYWVTVTLGKGAESWSVDRVRDFKDALLGSKCLRPSCGMWVQESQKRGAWHLHAVLRDPRSLSDLRTALLERCIALGGQAESALSHYRLYGVRVVEAVPSEGRLANYLVKYLSKGVGSGPEWGRMWGIIGRKHLPQFATVEEHTMSAELAEWRLAMLDKAIFPDKQGVEVETLSGIERLIVVSGVWIGNAVSDWVIEGRWCEDTFGPSPFARLGETTSGDPT